MSILSWIGIYLLVSGVVTLLITAPLCGFNSRSEEDKPTDGDECVSGVIP